MLIGITLITGLVLLRISSERSNNPKQPIPPQPTSNTTVLPPIENDEGNVKIVVSPLTLKSGFPASFDITFETHSVDLAFDVVDVVTLTDSNGKTYTPSWEGSPPGGHHRNGTLRFTPELIKATTVTLTINDIAGIPTRIFTWGISQ